MGFSTNNISNVKAMAFPLGINGNGDMIEMPGLILVTWDSYATDTLFQTYVDGELSGVTSVLYQRKLLVQYEHTHTAAIEVIAVDPEDMNVDYANELDGFIDIDGSHVLISWPKRGVLPLGSKAKVYWNSGSGEIDYNQALTTQTVWQMVCEKWGWGLDAMGRGDFGFSGTGAPGCGRGSFGKGEFGFDAELQSFQSESLSTGTYQFAVRLSDAFDNHIAQNDVTCQISVDSLPNAATLAIESYDEQLDSLSLNIG